MQPAGHALAFRRNIQIKLAEKEIDLRSANLMIRDVSDAEQEAFVDDGWVYLPGFIDTGLASEMLEASKAIMGQSGKDWSARPGIDAQLDHWHDRHFLARDGIAPFESLSHAPQMGHAVQKLIERNVSIRYWSDMIAVKPPVETSVQSTATPLHQDFSNKHFDRVGSVTFWIALEDMPAEKGTCRYRSGSHKLGPLGHEFGRWHPGGTGLDIHEVYPWLADRCPLSDPQDMKAGDATAHTGLTLHCAPENRTSTPRWAFIAIYIPGDALWTGSKFLGFDGADLKIGSPFDHHFFPIVTE